MKKELSAAERMNGPNKQWPRLYKAGRWLLSTFTFGEVRVIDGGLVRMQDMAGVPHIAAPRHQSNLDTGVMGEVYRQADIEDPYYVAKKELFVPGLAFLVRHVGGIRIDRELAKTDPTEVSRLQSNVGHVLNEFGQPVLIYPEGGRRPGDEVGDLFGGVAVMSVKCGVPILPFGIYGTAKDVRRHNGQLRPDVCVAVGEVIEPSRRLRATTDELAKSLQALTNQAKEAHQAA